MSASCGEPVPQFFVFIIYPTVINGLPRNPHAIEHMCASASFQHVRRDLELMNVVQHCRNLLALRCVELILLCWSPSLCKLSARLMCSASACISVAYLIEAAAWLRVSRSSSELFGLGFCFCFTLWNCSCGICSPLSVLCWTTGIHHFVSESTLRYIHCIVSSSLALWDLSLRRHAIVNNLVDELRLGNSTVCACSCGARFITAAVSSKIDSGTRTSTICSSIHSGVSFVCGQPSSV